MESREENKDQHQRVLHESATTKIIGKSMVNVMMIMNIIDRIILFKNYFQMKTLKVVVSNEDDEGMEILD